MRYLLPAMLNTARPSLRMLALRMARLTSAGVAQSAPLTCRYHAINGSRASACAGLLPMKALSVLSAMILTPIILPQSHTGTNAIFARWAVKLSDQLPPVRASYDGL